MPLGLHWRLTMFLAAIAAVFALLAGSAYTAWHRLARLQNTLEHVDDESFRIADEFQRYFLDLNHQALRYQLQREPALWARFKRDVDKLNEWIIAQNAKLERRPAVGNEAAVLRRLIVAYDEYQAAAKAMGVSDQNRPEQPQTDLSEVERLEKEAERLLKLGSELAKAHRDSRLQYVAESNQALVQLRTLFFGALVLLVLSGVGLSRVVYRDMIGPLRLKLVETQALAERHEKLASLGVLAAGVAHEVRNPLTAIRARVFTLQKRLAAPTQERADLDVIDREIDRLERIVKDFLLFARPSDPVFSVVSALRILQDAQALLAPPLEKRGVRLVLEDFPAAFVRIDPAQIKQVLINLVQNAGDAIGEDGEVRLRARVDTKTMGQRSTSVVILEVEDNGKGMTPEVQKRLFDPFYSTKEAGTGLGLSIAARIVEKHGGVLQFQTQPGRGSTFGVVLPRAHETSTTSNPC